MNITIWSDFVCPFCYIGQARLDKALRDFAHAGDVRVEYRSFILSPDAKYLPGQDYYQAFVEQKGVSLDEARDTFQRVRDMGREEGLEINFDIAKSANTYDAHRVMQYAREQGKDGAFFTQVYRAHFAKGEVISDQKTLLRLAGEVGLDEERAEEILRGDAYADALRNDLSQARSLGISVVPTFVFDHRYAMSGAQPVESFRQALERVWHERTH